MLFLHCSHCYCCSEAHSNLSNLSELYSATENMDFIPPVLLYHHNFILTTDRLFYSGRKNTGVGYSLMSYSLNISLLDFSYCLTDNICTKSPFSFPGSPCQTHSHTALLGGSLCLSNFFKYVFYFVSVYIMLLSLSFVFRK